MGMRQPDSAHPDTRAILYEEATYSKRRINGFLSALEGFQIATQLPAIFSSLFSSDGCLSLLRRVVCLERDGGLYPDLSEQLAFFMTSFDHAKARKEGTIVPARGVYIFVSVRLSLSLFLSPPSPSPGVNLAYDRAVEAIRDTASSLDDYLRKQRKRLGCPSIVYWGTGRNRFQLEVPESALARSIPQEYELKSQKKGHRRFIEWVWLCH